MISVVGFSSGEPRAQRPQHRNVRRQKSLLSESLRTRPSIESLSSEASWSSSESASEEPELASPRSPSSLLAEDSGSGIAILYTGAAKAKIDRAEAKGRARDEQLELLHAVRAYMADRQQATAGKAL